MKNSACSKFALIAISAFIFNSQINAQTISTICGTGTSGFSGDSGLATNAKIRQPWGIKLDNSGNIYFADYSNNRIRVIKSSGIITTVGGNGTAGFSGDGGAALDATFSSPEGVAIDAAGNIYVGDYDNNRIRKINTSGIITTIAGTGSAGFSGDGGPASLAELNHPGGIAMDTAGNLYIADYYNARIRKIDISGNISTVAGTGTVGITGDGGAATAAEINDPYSIYADKSGNLFIADGFNNRVRKVDNAGVITTIAGGGTSGLGDGGPATAAEINVAVDVTTDNFGNIYISDGNNSRIRKVNSDGIISTIAGTGTAGYSGDGGLSSDAEINHPGGIVTDAAGNIYIADWDNNRIRRISETTGIMGLAKSEPINVFPNPSTNSFVVTLPNIGNASELKLYDLLGNQIKLLEVSAYTDKIILNLNDLSRGTYILKVQSGNNYMTQKIVLE